MHNDRIVINIAGTDYVCKPNFQAAAMIETLLNKSVQYASVDVAAMSVRAIHAVLHAALESNGHKVDGGLLGDAVFLSMRSNDMDLIKSAVEYITAFFPKHEGDGTKKQEAQAIG